PRRKNKRWRRRRPKCVVGSNRAGQRRAPRQPSPRPPRPSSPARPLSSPPPPPLLSTKRRPRKKAAAVAAAAAAAGASIPLGRTAPVAPAAAMRLAGKMKARLMQPRQKRDGTRTSRRHRRLGVVSRLRVPRICRRRALWGTGA
ncbi:unnamed protein product, partial [Ectocarpus sp. 12 AP-2014]